MSKTLEESKSKLFKLTNRNHGDDQISQYQWNFWTQLIPKMKNTRTYIIKLNLVKKEKNPISYAFFSNNN